MLPIRITLASWKRRFAVQRVLIRLGAAGGLLLMLVALGADLVGGNQQALGERQLAAMLVASLWLVLLSWFDGRGGWPDRARQIAAGLWWLAAFGGLAIYRLQWSGWHAVGCATVGTLVWAAQYVPPHLPSAIANAIRARVFAQSGAVMARRLLFSVALCALILLVVLVWQPSRPTSLIRRAMLMVRVPPTATDIDRAIERGLVFLSQTQLATGELPGFSWLGTNVRSYWEAPIVFQNALILYSLRELDASTLAQRVQQGLVRWLLAEMDPPGTWRFFGARDTTWYTSNGFPKGLSADIDDTAAARLALKEYDVALPAGIDGLILGNRNSAGLFDTWLGDQNSLVGIDSKALDATVNANVLFYLSRKGIELPLVHGYVQDVAASGEYQDGTPYYSTPYAFLYSVSRAYRDGQGKPFSAAVPRMREFILTHRNRDGGFGNAQDTALAVISLLNLNYQGNEVDRAVAWLLSRQGEDGSWPTESLFRTAFSDRSEQYQYGSPSLTTGFCLEALSAYQQQKADPAAPVTPQH